MPSFDDEMTSTTAVRVFEFDRLLSKSSLTTFFASHKLTRNEFHDKLLLNDFNHGCLRPFWLALLTDNIELTTDIYTYIGQYGKYYSIMYKKMQAHLHRTQQYRFNLKNSLLDPSHYALLMPLKDFIAILPTLNIASAFIVEQLLQCMIFLNTQYIEYQQEYSLTYKTDRISILIPTDIYEFLHHCIQDFLAHHYTLANNCLLTNISLSNVDKKKDKQRITYISLWEITDVTEIQKAYHYKLNRLRRPVDYKQENFNSIVHGWVVVARKSSTFMQGVDDIDIRFKSHVHIAQLETTYPFRDVSLALCNLIKRMHHTADKYTFVSYKGLIMMMKKRPVIEDDRMYVSVEMSLCFERMKRDFIDWSYDSPDSEYPSRGFIHKLLSTMVVRGNLYVDYLTERVNQKQYDMSIEEEESLSSRFKYMQRIEQLHHVPVSPNATAAACPSPFSSASSTMSDTTTISATTEMDFDESDTSRSSTPRLIIDDTDEEDRKYPCITIDDDDYVSRPTVIVFAGKNKD